MGKQDIEKLEHISCLVRYWILQSTTAAGSGHPTSSLSATELMVGLMFGGMFRFRPDEPAFPNNDRLIFSKGHAAPLFYALWAAAGKVTEKELMTLRKFGSPLEGHPAMTFKYTEVATGSLGMGLSVGVGMALNAKNVDKLPYRTYVLMGDSEMAEGSVWEAIQSASHYQLDNLVGIIDVNRLGQRGETMFGHDVKAFERRVAAFGWHTITIDGHSLPQVLEAYEKAMRVKKKPVMIIAKTLKGKGVPFFEDKDDWHGKTLKKNELDKVLKEFGDVDMNIRGTLAEPEDTKPQQEKIQPALEEIEYKDPITTRKAYGNALVLLHPKYPEMIVLDAEVGNSSFAIYFQEAYPQHFFEMYIAEQNMVGVALGFSARGKTPFISTFAAFLARAHDQIRMAQYSSPNINIMGSHAGVSIGEDGPSQMALGDIAFFRSLYKSIVLYPSDAVATDKIVECAAEKKGLIYIRTTRGNTPIIYGSNEEFKIGGSKVLKHSENDAVTVVAAGITVHEALRAYEELQKDGINIRVIDLYSVKPVDVPTLWKAVQETGAIITVEDHYAEGGIGSAVQNALVDTCIPMKLLAVTKHPKSGSPDELLDYEGISSRAIIDAVKKIT